VGNERATSSAWDGPANTATRPANAGADSAITWLIRFKVSFSIPLDTLTAQAPEANAPLA
jgi:hypothetical protein